MTTPHQVSALERAWSDSRATVSALLAAAAAPRPSEAGAQYGAPRSSEACAGLPRGAPVEVPSTARFEEEEATDEESLRTVGALRRELLQVRQKARKLMEDKEKELGRLKSTLTESQGRAEKAESALREALTRHEVERIEMHQQAAARIAAAERSLSDAAQAAAAAAAAGAAAARGASSSTAAPEAATAEAAAAEAPTAEAATATTPPETPARAAPPHSLLVAPPLSLLSPVQTDIGSGYIGSGLSSTSGLMQLAQQQAMRDAQMRDHHLELAELRARLASADDAYENLRREMRELEMRSRRGGASVDYVKCLVLQLLQVSVVNCLLMASSDCL
jgi:chemotaxis protein histidine kinase CheA